MSLRRVTFVAIRILAIFFAVRGLRDFLVYLDQARSGAPAFGIQLAAYIVPLVAATTLWLGAGWLSVRCTGGEILTMRELQLLVKEGADEPATSTESVVESPPRPLLMVGLALIGAFLLVDALAPTVVSLLRFVLTKRLGVGCNGFLRESLPCRFWNPDAIQSLISLAARAVEIAVGLWLLLRPERAYEVVETIRRRGSSAGESETRRG